MSNLMYKLTVSQGVASIKQKIKSGEVDKTTIVVVADEVATAKKSIGGREGGLSDEELHRAVLEISHKCGLKTDCDDEPQEREVNLAEKMHLETIKAQSVTIKDVLMNGLKSALVDMARRDIAKGKLDPSKAYDLTPNAWRIIKAWRKNIITRRALKSFNVSDEELRGLIKNALVEVGFKEIKE